MQEETRIQQMDKKFKRFKKKEPCDLGSGEHTKRKSKQYLFGVGAEFENRYAEAVNSEGYANLGADNQHVKVMKKNKRKIIAKSDEVITNCLDEEPTAEETSFTLGNKDDRMQNKKNEVGVDSFVCVSQLEGQNDKDPKQKNKKKRNLKPTACKDLLNENVETDVKGKRSFQVNDGMDKEQASKWVHRRDMRKSNMEQVEGRSNVPFSTKLERTKSIVEDNIPEIVHKKAEDRSENKKNWSTVIEDNCLKGKKKGKYKVEFGSPGQDCHKDRRDKTSKKKSKIVKKKKKDGHAALSGLVVSKTHDIEGKIGQISKSEMTNSVDYDSEKLKPKGKMKKVTFSSHIEVFHYSDHKTAGKEKEHEKDLIRGKRFSPEEDEIVTKAVLNYIEAHDLGEEGLKMVLHCKAYPEIKRCWKDIGAALPYRPYRAIYFRAHILFERDEKRVWTEEEYEVVRKFQRKNGNNWKAMAEELGKHRVHVRDTWRRIKFANLKRGNWSQDEYQNLFDLVNMDLRKKAFEDKKSKHGMLRDNICWSSISDKLSTRSNSTCCLKWYSQLTSSMVADGVWADSDDYRLLDALCNLDACCIEDVNWDNLLDCRSGDLCRKRWDQMVLHLGIRGSNSFAEQVETLAKRYCPGLLEVRDTWERKPVVP